MKILVEKTEDRSQESEAIFRTAALLMFQTITDCLFALFNFCLRSPDSRLIMGTPIKPACGRQVQGRTIKKDADYMLMVKNNQPELKRQVEKLFMRGDSIQTDKQLDGGHGRVETRICDVIGDLRFMDERQHWEGLKSIVRVQSERYNKKTQKTSHETRYYISSLDADAKKSNDAIRKHWSIENNLHWTLDVVFKEDSSFKKER